jgi:multidrug efflux pump subunit AcrB
MRLPRLAIENHQFTTVVIALLVLSGVVSYFTMPRSEDPIVTPPGTSIVVVYPGASPADLEQLVADPIEEVLNELEDIKVIVSDIEDGIAVIDIEFLTGSDADDKYSDVTQKVNSIRSSLPEDILELEMIKWSISDTKIMQLAIVSDTASYDEIQTEAERLEDLLETCYGVTKIEIEAYPEQQVRISIDLEKASSRGISLWDITRAVQAGSADIPGGSVELGDRKFTLHTSGDFPSIDDIRRTIVATYAGKVVYLGDIADVGYGYADETHTARFDGRRAVWLSLSQKERTNIFKVMNGIYPALEDFRRGLPSSMTLETVIDQSESVSERVGGFFASFAQGVALVGIVILLALGLRASAIVMLAIPFSIAIAIGFVDLNGFGLQQMSIVGLVIALGLLVDNAIVVVENVSRFILMGHSRFEAAVKGTGQIAWAVVSATVTTLLAFLPLASMQSISGDFIRSMPMTVIYCLSASLLVSLTLTPYLSSRFLKRTEAKKPGRARRLLNSFIENRYRRAIGWALGRPKTVVALALAAFVASFALFPVVGFSLFPKSGKMQFLINVWAPEGTTLTRTDDISRYIESVLEDREEVLHYVTNVGNGNPRIYYNMHSPRNRNHFAQIFVRLEDIGIERMANLVDELRDEFDRYPGAWIEVKEFEQGPPVEAPVAIRVIGDNMNTLNRLAAEVEEMIRSTEGAVNVHNPLRTSKTDLHVNINREKAAMLGVPLVDIDRTVRAAISGLTVSRYRDAEGKNYDIVVRLPIDNRPGSGDLDRIHVTSMLGAQIPIRQLADVEFKAAPVELSHHNLERNVMVKADVARGYSIDRVTRAVVEKLDAYSWPSGYRYYVGGEAESREASFSGIFKAIIIAIISIFAVLVLQFRSYRQPFIVFAAIPLAFIGSILALLITGYSFSFTASIGLTSLMGIVINNSIILVVYTNQLRGEGKGLKDALTEAGETRFVPIILTTATTISGLLPLTLSGGDMWGAMGWTIIGGLVVSTILTLIVVPVLYLLSERGRKIAKAA